MGTLDISVLRLLIGLLLVFIPAGIFRYFKTGLVGTLFISVARMVLQLFLVGFYLNYLFEWNNIWINIAWMLLMTAVCSINLLRRIKLPIKLLFIPIYISVFTALTTIVVYFLKAVLNLDYLFDSRYFIPMCGIILGNILSSNVIGLNAFYDTMLSRKDFYDFMLCNGATVKEATKPFFREALIQAFNPTLASMAVMGLISLPGTLIGQIMGGSAPGVAIRYQIMIMIIIMTASVVSLVLSMIWSTKKTLDSFGNIKQELISLMDK